MDFLPGFAEAICPADKMTTLELKIKGYLLRCVSLISVLIVTSCATAPQREEAGLAKTISQTRIFHAEFALQDEWQHLPIRGENEYRLAVIDGKIAIRAVGLGFASGLIRHINVDTTKCPWMEWAWRVEKIQEDADIRVREKEDVAAAVFLLFGDPGLMVNPQPVPTLRYVWTNGKVPKETVVDSPYLPGTVRSIVVQSGNTRIKEWVTERRNVVRDFEKAFGTPPKERVQAVAIFTDNDQTKQPVEAYYRWARVICTTGELDGGKRS